MDDVIAERATLNRRTVLSGLAASTLAVHPAMAAIEAASRSIPRMTPDGPAQPFVDALQGCVTATLRNSRYLKDFVVIDQADAEAIDTRVNASIPPSFISFLSSLTRRIGFNPMTLTPDLRRVVYDVKSQLRPDLIISGTISGFTPLKQRWDSATNGGIGFGKGTGAATLSGDTSRSTALGSVMATMNLSVFDTRAGVVTKDGQPMPVFPLKTTSSCAVDFFMVERKNQISGAVAIALGIGHAAAKVQVFDPSEAAQLAIRTALLLAITEHYELSSTGACT
jgi:hypothetical protein